LETHFIDALIVQHIKEIGEGRVLVVCMDGAYKGVFVLIQKEFPWVQCFVCPSHAIDRMQSMAWVQCFVCQSGTNHTPVDSISFVLDFTSRLLEMGENPFGKTLGEEKGTWLESSVFFFFHFYVFLFSFENYFVNLN
jgi:hypothetical protein